MKKSISLILLCVCFASCGSDDEEETVYKTVTVQIERDSEYLSELEENNAFTVDTKTEYNKADWSVVTPNEGKLILTKVKSGLSKKEVFSFKQEKVNLQLISAYYLKNDDIDEDDISFASKVTILVNDKVVKTETFSFVNAYPNIITYSE